MYKRMRSGQRLFFMCRRKTGRRNQDRVGGYAGAETPASPDGYIYTSPHGYRFSMGRKFFLKKIGGYRQQYVRDFIDGINWEYVHRAVAAMRGAVYCLAVPTGDSKINNAILEYNTQERTFNIREGVYVDSFLAYEDELYFTDGRASDGGAVYHFRGGAKMLPMEYITAYQDLGYKGVTKSGFELYLTADAAISVTAAIRTEKKYKAKTVQLEANKTKKLRLNATGRMFRLELRVPETTDAWKLLGTVEIDLETDWD